MLTSVTSTDVEVVSTGLKALLVEPAASTVVPYLLSLPKTFSNLSQHRSGGTTDNAAYEVAARKMDVIRALAEQLRKSDLAAQDPRLERLIEMLNKRIGEGTMGRSGMGREIATVEL